MFIGEDGKVFTVRHFKGVVAGSLCVLIALAVTLFFLQHQNGHRLEEIRALERGTAALEAQNESLKREKEQMLARQVILESRLKALQGGDAPNKEKAASPATAEAGGIAGENAGPAESTAEKQSTPPTSTEKAEQAADPEIDPTPPPPVTIANRDLVVCRDPHAEFIRVAYKVVNVGPKHTRVTGRSVIVLKNNDMNPEDWIVLPNVPLHDLRPSGESGKRFRIYNFRTLNYRVAESKLKGPLHSATIYTYTEEGALLMERDYSLDAQTEICP